MLKLKRIVCMVSAVAIMITMSACGGGENAAKNADGKTVITIDSWPSKDKYPENYEHMETVRKAFMEKYPDIEVKTDVWTYSVDTFLAKAAANQLPTGYYLPYTEVDKVINAGYVADVSEYAVKYGYTTHLQDNILQYLSRDGKLYIIPTDVYYLELLANKNLFEEAGLVDENGLVKFPKTMDELGKMAGQIKEKTGKAGFIMPTMKNIGGWHFMNIAWAFGTEFMAKENGKWVAKFNSPEGEKALGFIKDLKWKYNALSENTLIDDDEGKKMLASGQGAMFISLLNDGIMTNLMKNGLEPDKIAAGKIPAGPAGQYALIGGSLYAVNKDATPDQIDAIFKWLEFIGNSYDIDEQTKKNKEEEFKLRVQENRGVLPKTPYSIWKDGTTVDEIDKLREKYTNGKMENFKEIFELDGVIIKAEEPVNCQELYTILDNCIQAVLNDKNADVAAVLNDAAHNFQVNYLDSAK